MLHVPVRCNHCTCSSTYPFAGTALVLLDTFGLESQSAAAAASGTAVGVPAFGMRVRLKRRIDSDAARAKSSDSPSTASQQQTTTSRNRFECTRLEEIEVRRAPSNAVSCSATANAIAASGTRWIWWLRNSGKRLLQESTSHWIDATVRSIDFCLLTLLVKSIYIYIYIFKLMIK